MLSKRADQEGRGKYGRPFKTRLAVDVQAAETSITITQTQHSLV